MPRIEIQQLIETAITVSPDTLIRDLKKRITGGEALQSAVVLEKERPLGLIMSHHLDRALSHRYGVSLYHNRAVDHIMDARPLLVPAAAALEVVAAKAMDRLPARTPWSPSASP
jgi:hypothetical protein